VTIAQALTALVALVVATVVYRWQKAVDRETSIQSELRKLYAAYISAMAKGYLNQPYIDDANDPEKISAFFRITSDEQEFYALRDQIYLLAPEDVLDAVRAYDLAFRQWKIGFPRFCQNANGEQAVNAEQHRERDAMLRRSRQITLDVMRSSLREHTTFKNSFLLSLRGSTK